MPPSSVTRRDFLQNVSVAGIAMLASVHTSSVVAAESMPEVKKAVFICSRCGHIEFGTAPGQCPVCHAPKDQFNRSDSIFSDTAAKFKDVNDKHIPVIRAKKVSSPVTEKPSISMEAKIGSVIHPMEEAHHIQFIDCYIDDVHACRVSLTVRNHPTAGIDIKVPAKKSVRVVVLCNLHGYWQSEAVPV